LPSFTVVGPICQGSEAMGLCCATTVTLTHANSSAVSTKKNLFIPSPLSSDSVYPQTTLSKPHRDHLSHAMQWTAISTIKTLAAA
jgi:hypothetical protein